MSFAREAGSRIVFRAQGRIVEIAALAPSRANQWGEDMADYALHAAYDNAAAVPETPAFLARWAEASRRLRAERPGGLDIVYGEGERRRIDLFPAASPEAPCFVFVHGGYWQKNGREGFACMAQAFLARGWSAALPSHTLAPDASLSEIAAEIRAALDFLQARGREHGIAGRAVLSGWSAGGHLAALTAGHPFVHMAAPISGIFDLAPLRRTRYDDALKLTDAEIDTLSPVRLAPVAKPHLTFVGGAELPELRRQSQLLRSHRAGVAGDGFYEIAGRHHFDVLDDLMAGEGVIFREITRAFAAAS